MQPLYVTHLCKLHTLVHEGRITYSPIVKMRQGKINEIICIVHKNQIINLANNYLYLRWKKESKRLFLIENKLEQAKEH